MKIIFIQHSCFWIEESSYVLIFDWFDATRVNLCEFKGQLPEFPKGKKIYLFASHKHQDHFDLMSLRWRETKCADITYILSKDIRLSDAYLIKYNIDPSIKKHIVFVRANDDYQIDELRIHTLKSTDAGVAFYVKIKENSFYHAGDLNSWIFPNDFDEVRTQHMQQMYERELSYLKNKKITMAFVVLDPRQKEKAYHGLSYFFEQFEAKFIFPMHMWQDYSYITRWKKYEKELQKQFNQDQLEKDPAFIEENSFIKTQNRLDQVIEIVNENELFEFKLL